MAALEGFRGMNHRGQMRFLGAGPLEATIRSGAGEDVAVLGSVPDVAPHLEWADVLILTSQTEGLPGVALEASAAAVPVIAFDVGGLSEVVVDEVTGLLVGRGDIRALTDAMDRVAGDPALLASMSRAARERMRSGYTMSHAVDRYAAVLTETCR
jgi:glycosyltransferase involved in cell wall biosynthesis